MLKNRIFIQLCRAIPQKKRRIFLISNLQEYFRKIVSIERIDETRAFAVNKRLAVALMSQRQPLERSRNRSVNSPINGHFHCQGSQVSAVPFR